MTDLLSVDVWLTLEDRRDREVSTHGIASTDAGRVWLDYWLRHCAHETTSEPLEGSYRVGRRRVGLGSRPDVERRLTAFLRGDSVCPKIERKARKVARVVVGEWLEANG